MDIVSTVVGHKTIGRAINILRRRPRPVDRKLQVRVVAKMTWADISNAAYNGISTGIAEEPCGQCNNPKSVQQVLELALSTFDQKWPPAAIQIYGRLQKLQDHNSLDLSESDTWKRSYSHHTNSHRPFYQNHKLIPSIK
ncbi:hypothetical protein MGYG_06803 [Nannizzia gypsea CBS 118893]|uniref:Uncharacterized protein n=1 Tax=Arthroderma gypseum (strain ATCC MYA-4604 / CBS 118893) TaxID=535722 RepID=E4V189_ARTGP|nr:hypothetical protein MGYG_06803 [Nannizzia gypsea CBS 118893]EFR03804.1 hypothetical protein MGYG_06803 [Nannizzia gypsea CBS 118893]